MSDILKPLEAFDKTEVIWEAGEDGVVAMRGYVGYRNGEPACIAIHHVTGNSIRFYGQPTYPSVHISASATCLALAHARNLYDWKRPSADDEYVSSGKLPAGYKIPKRKRKK